MNRIKTIKSLQEEMVFISVYPGVLIFLLEKVYSSSLNFVL